MADDVKGILSQIQNARKAGATSQDVQNLTDKIEKLSRTMDAGTTARGVLRDIHSRMQGTVIPSGRAIVAAAASASPAFSAARSLYYSQKDYRNQVAGQISNIKGEDLKVLNEELKKLSKEIKDGPAEDKPKVTGLPDDLTRILNHTVDLNGELLKVNLNQLDMLDELYKVWSGETSPMVEAIRAESKQSQEFYRTFLDNQARDSLANTETKPKPTSAPESSVPEAASEDGKKSMLSGLLGSVMSISGLDGLFMGMRKLIKPISKVTKLLKIGPLALISSIYDFGEGFFNAEEILHKGEVTIGERVQAGMMNLVGGFGALFDMISGWLGFDTNAQEYLKEKTQYIMHYPAMVIDGFIDVLKGAFEGVDGSTALTDVPAIVIGNIKEMVIGAFNNILNSDFVKSVVDGASGVKDTVVNYATDRLSAVMTGITGFFDTIYNFFMDKIKSVVDFLPDWIKPDMTKIKATNLTGNFGQQPYTPEGNVTPSENNPSPVARRLDDASRANRAETVAKERKEQQERVAAIMLNNQNNVNTTQNTSVIKTGINSQDPDAGFAMRGAMFGF